MPWPANTYAVILYGYGDTRTHVIKLYTDDTSIIRIRAIRGLTEFADSDAALSFARRTLRTPYAPASW